MTHDSENENGEHAESAPTKPSTLRKSDLGWLLLLAAAIRLASIGFAGSDILFTKYSEAAAQMQSGSLFGARILDFSPIYLDFHRLVLGLGFDSPLFIQVLQGLIGALNCALVALIAYPFLASHGPRRLSPRWFALGAGLLMALTLELNVYDQLFEPEPLLTFFVLASWAVTTSASQKITSGGRILGFLLGGLLLGLAIGTRPSAWILLPAMPFAAGFSLRRRGEPTAQPHRRLPRAAAGILLFAIGLLLIQGGLHWRNQSFGEGASMSPWQVLYTGNNPTAHGMWREDFLVKDLEYHSRYLSPDFAHQTFRDVAMAHGKSGASAERFWLDLSLQYIQEYPEAFLRLLVQKSLALGQPIVAYDFHQADTLRESLESWPLIPYGIIFVFGLAGWLLSPRRLAPIVFVALCQAAVFLVFFVSSRYRVLCVPWLCIGAASWLCFLIDSLRLKQGLRIGGALSLPLGLFTLFAWPLPPGHEIQSELEAARKNRKLVSACEEAIEEDRFADAQAHLEEAYYQMPWHNLRQPIARLRYRQKEMATKWLDRAREAVKQSAEPRDFFRLATLLEDAGLLDEAQKSYEQCLLQTKRAGYRHLRVLAWTRLGIFALKSNDLEAAKNAFQNIQDLQPGSARGLVGLALADPDQADDYLEAAKRVSPALQVDYEWGRMALDVGRNQEAQAPLQRLVKALPNYARGRLLYAHYLSRVNEPAKAYNQAKRAQNTFQWLYDPDYRILPIIQTATRMFPERAPFWVTLSNAALVYGDEDATITAYENLERLGAMNGRMRTQFGRFLLSFGHPQRAALELEKALEEDPDNLRAKQGLEEARRQMNRSSPEAPSETNPSETNPSQANDSP